jgi:hypothetical protein
MINNLVSIQIDEAIGDVVQDFAFNIVHPAAYHTAYVIMILGRGVEALLYAADFHLADQSAFGEDFQVSVDGSQADAGELLPDHFIDFVRGRM